MAIVSVRGLAVEYEQQGTGPDLLLVHSLLTELTVFERVVPALAAGRRVTRFNLPGFGASAPSPFATVADVADHLAAVMDALGLPRTTDVFGNGFGAFVTLELACRHGARFGRLVVADALAAFPEPARAPFRGMAQAVRAGGMPAVLDAAIGRMFPPTFAEAHADLIGARKKALATVDALPPDAGVGVIFPDAEEYGMVGARALVRERGHLLADTAVVNLDGIDDRGAPIAVIHRAGPLVGRVAAALGARRVRWLPVLVDGMVLARAAREAVTIMRGDWTTARIVHTSRDAAQRLALDGVRDVARALARSLTAP